MLKIGGDKNRIDFSLIIIIAQLCASVKLVFIIIKVLELGATIKTNANFQLFIPFSQKYVWDEKQNVYRYFKSN